MIFVGRILFISLLIFVCAGSTSENVQHTRHLLIGAFFEATRRFLGSLPLNDPRLMEESGPQSGGTVEEARDFFFVHLNECDALTIGYVVVQYAGVVQR